MLQDRRLFVREKLPPLTRSRQQPPSGVRSPRSVLIVGGGAAGEAAATTLRFHGYEGPVRILSAEHDLPPDRPNLSKDYLAGIAPAEWVPIRSASYYRQHGIELLLNTPVAALDTASQKSAQPMAGSSPTVRFCSPPALNP